MKVLIYQPRASYYVGGGEVVPINQAVHLINSGFDVTFVTSKAHWLHESDIFRKFKKGFKKNIIQIEIPQKIKNIYEIEPGQDWKRWDLESLHFGLFAEGVIKNIDYDVALCHLPLDLIALNQTKRNIVYLHGYPKILNYACEVLLYTQQEFIAVSEKVREEWLKLLPNKKVVTVYNGIDTKRFVPLQQDKKQYDILFVGRLVENKGILNLLPILHQLILNKEEIKVALVGTGPLFDKIMEYIEEYNLFSNIKLCGYVSDDELLDFYQNTKIAIFPSLSKEGILTTVLEATACGVPVISSNGLGLDAYIKDGENGFLIDMNNKECVIKVVEKMLSNEILLKNMANKARNLSFEWDWNIRIKDLEKIINQHE